MYDESRNTEFIVYFGAGGAIMTESVAPMTPIYRKRGHFRQLNDILPSEKKKKRKPFRKPWWEDPGYNPALEKGPISQVADDRKTAERYGSPAFMDKSYFDGAKRNREWGKGGSK